MDNSGLAGFLECMFWESQFFFWTFSVSSTYNIVTMTVERSIVLNVFYFFDIPNIILSPTSQFHLKLPKDYDFFHCRYLELVHPLWHKSNFKIRWIYIALAVNVSLSIIFPATYKLPTTKV